MGWANNHARQTIIRVSLATAFLLLVPLVAMLFTDEVAWGPLDFAVAGVLLFSAGLTYEWSRRRRARSCTESPSAWRSGPRSSSPGPNLAAELIGDEGSPANLLCGGVVAVGVVGALIARLQPQGMAQTLFAMALAQALVPLIAVIVWRHSVTSREEALRVLGVTAFFVTLFVGSALLFRRASATSST